MFQALKRSVLSRCNKLECRQFARKLQSYTADAKNNKNLCTIPKIKISRHPDQLLDTRSTEIFFRRNIKFSSILKSGVQVAEYEEIKDLPKHPEKLLIDVREPAELAETGEIPTSINIPLGEVTQELAHSVSSRNFEAKYGRKKPDEKSEIIFSCKSGKRSRIASESVLALGYKNVKSYDGSWTDWAQHEGLKN